MDLEIVWTGALETAAIKAQQLRAPTCSRFTLPNEPNTRVDVLRYLERHPGATLGRIAAGLGKRPTTVNSSLYRLLELGYVVRSHRQHERPEAVRWSLAVTR